MQHYSASIKIEFQKVKILMTLLEFFIKLASLGMHNMMIIIDIVFLLQVANPLR